MKYRDFLRNIDDIFGGIQVHNGDINMNTSVIMNFLIKVMNKYFSIVKKIISSIKLNCPWVTNDILKCIKK